MSFPSQFYTCAVTGNRGWLPNDMCEFLNAVSKAVIEHDPGAPVGAAARKRERRKQRVVSSKVE